MANTLTNLIPAAYAALDVVSRELVGLIPSVLRDSTSDRVAKGQTLYSPVSPVNTQGDITPAMTVTAASDQTIATKSLTIDAYKTSGFNWTGEEEFGVNTGVGLENIIRDQIAQCLRVHVNAIELALYNAAYVASSRAFGTAATSPFASTLTDPANIKKILDDNGAPLGDRSLVINTTAGAALRTLAQLTKANEAADTTLLRQGTLLDIHGFAIRESAQISSITAGTGASYTTTNAGYAVGTTTLHMITGTGTILAGDVVTFAGDTNKYIVKTGFAGDGTGDIVLQDPGLRVAMSAATKAMTIVAASSRCLGFSRNAIQLATRLPKVPTNGDMASDRQVITDPKSGLSFELAMYPGYRMVKYEVAVAYGTAIQKPEHIATLLGAP